MKTFECRVPDMAPRLWIRALLACLILQGAVDGHAQGYPAKPVRYIIPSTGGTEIVGRLVAQGMTEVLGQQVFVDPRTGAAGNLGAEIAARSPADGYTVFQVTQSHTFNSSYFRKLPFDLTRDFAAITKTDIAPMVVVVHPSFPAKSMGDLVKLAQARPGKIDYASAGVGTSTYLAAELFKMAAGLHLVEVPYRSGAPSLTAVLAGEVPVYFGPIATVMPFVRQGKLRALAVSTSKRLPMLPEYPTVAESGYPGYEASNWHGLMVPAKTPKEIVAALHAAAVAAINRPDIGRRLQELGYTIVGDQPDEFSEFIKADIEKWRKVVRQRGISAE